MIAIRTTFGENTGLGHLVRMSFLAEECTALNKQVLFLIDYHRKKIEPFTKQHSVEFIYPNQPEVLDEQNDADLCKQILSKYNVEMIVVDNYSLGMAWENSIKRAGYQLTVIDDIQRKHHCDVLVDQAWKGLSHTFSRYAHLVPKDCITLLGPDYAMIDPIYSSPPPPSPQQPSILFSLGGGGDLDLLCPVLEKLSAMEDLDSSIFFQVVLGPLSKNKAMIRELAGTDPRIHPIDSPPSLYPYYSKTSLFVGALGTSLYETAALKIPALTFSLADNQIHDIKHLENFGHYFHLSLDEFRQPGKVAKLISVLMSNLDRIRTLRQDPLICFDGKGAQRIANVICHGKIPVEPEFPLVHRVKKAHQLSKGIRFREVQDDDINHYLESRNLIQNMDNMTTADSIASVDHYAWWFTKQRSSYLFEKNCQKALYIWHERVDYSNQSFLIGGWFVCSETVGFEMATAALGWQLELTEKECPGVPWIAIIKKTNKFVNLLNRYMGFVEVEPGELEYKAIRHFFGDPSPEQFNYVKKTP